MDFSRKTVLVTGAGGGLGSAVAVAFASCGARVLCADIDANGVEPVVRRIGEQGGRANAMTLDVTDLFAATELADRMRHDGDTLDCLVNVAGGLAGGQFEGGVEKLSGPAWQACLELNLASVFYMSKAFWPLLTARRGSNIINTSSVMGMVGGAGTIAYCTAKAALMMLTRCLAKEGAVYGLRVNCVCPGYVETQPMREHIAHQSNPAAYLREIQSQIPLGHMAAPADIAALYLLIASDQASYVTGSSLLADGGLSSGWFDDDSASSSARIDGGTT